MPTRRDPSADYPVRNGEGDIIVAWPHNPGPDYPVFDGNGQVIIAVPYEGYGRDPGPDYQRVVVIGASLEYSMYLNNLETPFATATNELGMGIPVYGCATSGARTRALIANVQQAVAAFPAVGETLFLVHPTGNDITSSLEYSQRSPAQLDALRLDLNDFLDAFGAHLPHVVPILSSFRSYTGRGYGAREIYNAQEKGSKPFNDNVFGPIYQARTRSRWRYANGGDMICFYDMTRNDFETYLQADGIHFTWPGVTGIRAEQLRRLRLWLTGTPAAQLVPDPVDPPPPDPEVTPEHLTMFAPQAADWSWGEIRDEDGAVVLEHMRCRGCTSLACLIACPYAAFFSTGKSVLVDKCDLCKSRRKNGMPPACMEMCPCGAIRFVKREDLASLKTPEWEASYRQVLEFVRPSVVRNLEKDK